MTSTPCCSGHNRRAPPSSSSSGFSSAAVVDFFYRGWDKINFETRGNRRGAFLNFYAPALSSGDAHSPAPPRFSDASRESDLVALQMNMIDESSAPRRTATRATLCIPSHNRVDNFDLFFSVFTTSYSQGYRTERTTRKNLGTSPGNT